MPGRNSARSAGRRHARDPVGRIREVVGEQPEARDRRGPAPVGGLELEQVDLERVAGLGAVDRDRAVDLVDPEKSSRREVVDGRRRGQLPAARVEQVELDDRRRSSTVSIGGIAGSQARWNRSRPTWINGVALIACRCLPSRGRNARARPEYAPDPAPTSP